MLIQAHWQNRNDLTETRMIAQGDFTSAEIAIEWSQGVFRDHLAEMPEGWRAMVCTEESPCFVRLPRA